MAKVHEQDPDDDENHGHPGTDLDNYHLDDSYQMQDSNVEELLDIYGHYSSKMTSFYHISKYSASSYGSLVDRGAHGSLAGVDVHIMERTSRKVSVTGIDDHELPGLDVVPYVALILTTIGKCLIHEYASYGRGNTIHSPCQIEWFNNTSHGLKSAGCLYQ